MALIPLSGSGLVLCAHRNGSLVIALSPACLNEQQAVILSPHTVKSIFESENVIFVRTTTYHNVIDVQALSFVPVKALGDKEDHSEEAVVALFR